MERHVKERLVGAAVLMAAAIILIPEMLSGPERSETEEASLDTSSAAEGPIKTYTIDLDSSPGSAAVPTVTEERAPPPERTELPAAERTNSAAATTETPTPDQAKPESPAEAAPTASPADDEARSQTEKAPVSQASAERSPTGARSNSGQPASRSAEPPPSARPLASQSNVPTSRGWAVQLGSFSNRSTAEELAAEFRAERYDAFVMPVKTATATLYRVRIGPMKDRASAEDMLRKVKAKVPGAAVLIHP